MKREEREQLLKDTLLYFAPKDRYVTDEEGNVYYREDVTLKAMELSEQPLPPAEGAEIDDMMFTISEDGINPLDDEPTAEGAEEIIESIVESLGEPMNINNHIFEIRPYTVEHKTEWWIFHKEVASGEPLAQWLSKFATLHAQQIADKMVSERLREELIKYDKWVGEKEIDNYRPESAPNAVDTYLKNVKK